MQNLHLYFYQDSNGAYLYLYQKKNTWVFLPRILINNFSSEESFEQKLVETSFNGNYVDYVSIGDKNTKLSLSE